MLFFFFVYLLAFHSNAVCVFSSLANLLYFFFRACCYFFIKLAKCGSALQLYQFFFVLASVCHQSHRVRRANTAMKHWNATQYLLYKLARDKMEPRVNEFEQRQKSNPIMAMKKKKLKLKTTQNFVEQHRQRHGSSSFGCNRKSLFSTNIFLLWIFFLPSFFLSSGEYVSSLYASV